MDAIDVTRGIKKAHRMKPSSQLVYDHTLGEVSKPVYQNIRRNYSFFV